LSSWTRTEKSSTNWLGFAIEYQAQSPICQPSVRFSTTFSDDLHSVAKAARAYSPSLEEELLRLLGVEVLELDQDRVALRVGAVDPVLHVAHDAAAAGLQLPQRLLQLFHP